jgi:hemolysin III
VSETETLAASYPRPEGAKQSVGEEVANASIHGLGLAASLVAIPVLAVFASREGDWVNVAAASVFGITLVLMFLTSTLYHAIPDQNTKKVLRVLDHSAIYVLIAGTYTPFAVGVLRGPIGWWLLGLIWVLAIAGVIKKLFIGARFPRLSSGLYLAMGWLVVGVMKPLWTAMDAWGLIWLFAGGIAYSIGVYFHAKDERPFWHMIWHLFVLFGTVCHFIAVLFYAQ